MKADRLALDCASGRRIDEDGHLHVSMSNISKATVNPYYGSEIPNANELGLQPDRIYNLLRDPAELEAAAETFEGKPLLVGHKPQTAEDHSHEMTVGAVRNVKWAAPYLQAELDIWAGDAIQDIQSGAQRELSSAYRYDADMTPGEYEGERYDGVMRNLRGNHVALVETGRAGPDVIVGDSKLKPSKQEPRMPKATVSLSPKATVAQRAFAIYLKPRIAADAAIDLAPMLKGVTAKTWDARKAGLIAKIAAEAKPHLAADADLEDISEVIDMLDGVLPVAEDDDPEDDDDEDEKKKKKPAMDEDDDKDDKKKDDDKKPAMDSATVQRMIMQAKSETMAGFRAMRDAEEFVRPYVGPVAIAQDSADAVYKLALDTLGVDIEGVHPSAYRAVLKAQPLPGDAPKIAQDSAASGSEFAKMFPEAAKLIRN